MPDPLQQIKYEGLNVIGHEGLRRQIASHCIETRHPLETNDLA
jgi:hypothetical protein